MTSRAWIFAFFTAAIAVPTACTFPPVTFGPSGSSSSGSGSNGGASSSGNPTTGGGGNASTQNTGGTGQGGAGGAGGQGNNGGASTTSAGGNGTGGGPACPHDVNHDQCDCDGDHHRKTTCTVGPAPDHDPNDDCADYDARAYKGQTAWFTSPIKGLVDDGTTPYDFNCNGQNDYEYPKQVLCMSGGLQTCDNTEGWPGPVPDCNMGSSYVTNCKNLCVKTVGASRTQGCH